jgi:serine/threonine protein kinase
MHPWSIDIWSLGAIILEVVIGFPLWLSYKGRIIKDRGSDKQEASHCMMGLFGIQGRIPKKIIAKQLDTLRRLKSTLKKHFSARLCLGPGLNIDPQFIDLLQ